MTPCPQNSATAERPVQGALINLIEISDSKGEDDELKYFGPGVTAEDEEVPQVSGRLVVWTTTHLTLS